MLSDGLIDLAESPLTATGSSSVAVFEAIAVNQFGVTKTILRMREMRHKARIYKMD